VTDPAPRRISDREVPINLTGYFMPMIEPNVPVLLGMPGTDDLFVAVFSTEKKLRSTMRIFKIGYQRISKVTDGKDFIADIEATNQSGGRSYRIRIAIDPYRGPNGRLRFVEPLAVVS